VSAYQGTAVGDLESAGHQITVLTNPVEDVLRIQTRVDKAMALTVQIVSMTGQVQLVQTIYSEVGLQLNELQVNGLAKGMYVLLIKSGTARVCKKIVKN
jgi:hypothetical protein